MKAPHAIDALAERKANGARPLEIIPFEEMVEPDLSTRSLVKGLLDTTAIALIYGESGCGKTVFALDLSLHIAAGQEWFGRRVTQTPVVYVATEAGRSIKNRVVAFAREKKCSGPVYFRAVVSPVDLCHLGKGDDVDRLVEAIDEAGVVVIDTVSRAMAGGNENGPEDMGAFVTAMDLLRARLGCAVIAIHHVGKDASRGSRGHSLLHCAVDTEIAVERREGICVATVTKQRDGISGDRINFLLRPVELGTDQDGDPVTTCVVEPSDWAPPPKETKRLSPGEQRALDALNAAVAERGTLIRVGETEIKAVSVAAWYDAMEERGLFSATSNPRMVWLRARKLAEREDPLICFRWLPSLTSPDDEQSFVWPTRPELPF